METAEEDLDPTYINLSGQDVTGKLSGHFNSAEIPSEVLEDMKKRLTAMLEIPLPEDAGPSNPACIQAIGLFVLSVVKAAEEYDVDAVIMPPGLRDDLAMAIVSAGAAFSSVKFIIWIDDELCTAEVDPSYTGTKVH